MPSNRSIFFDSMNPKRLPLLLACLALLCPNLVAQHLSPIPSVPVPTAVLTALQALPRAGTVHFSSGELELTLRSSGQGVAVEGLRDSKHAQELLAPDPPPLFTLALRPAGKAGEVLLTADKGWRRWDARPGAGRLELIWAEPVDAALAGLSVTAIATADARAGALRWNLRVNNTSTNWSLWRVTFPQLALASLGTNGAVLFPRGPGEVQYGVWDRPYNYRGSYPDNACTMQFMAAYRAGAKATGLYLATQDPWGSTKNLEARSEPGGHRLLLAFEHPVPNMGLAGNGFTLEGEAVWRLLRGDWFDAAMIYRDWAKREAKWWPRLGAEGRADTPRWMRELNVWTMTGGAASECVPAVKRFREFLALPVGFHWYSWHQIPFDNDYPHYFPAKEGFAPGVAELKSAGVFPMPYINGRLWDSHDRGAEDFEFGRIALPAATKREDGSPYLESYGSKETNGQPVRLAVMCPSTPLWQNTVSNIVLRLLRECGTSAVYIDQVAAAEPKLCMDASHGHPLGGGHWWTEGYWKMLDGIRAAKPPETALTTECNSEPFIRWFDGYLTWHWQHDGQVPAFPAIYGGAIQMFGRAYRGGATRDLALRMKAGQQLVFGEQLGWLDPGLLSQPDNAEFFRQLARLRARFSRFFYAGAMARPPELRGQVPQVKADWQWSDEWWVRTDALLAGAWELAAERRLVLLFVNVSDAPVQAAVWPDQAGWGLPPGAVPCEVTIGGSNASATATAPFRAPVSFPARQAQAWELRW